MPDKSMSVKEAYLAMLSFLKDYYRRTKSDDVGSILSSMCLMSDGKPMDIAYWDEWGRSVEEALSEEIDAQVRLVKDSASQ